MTPRRTAYLLAFSLLVAGCSSSSGAGSGGAVVPVSDSTRAARLPIGTYIKHVVILIQENRTFDNLFDGYPGADTVTSGKNSAGQMVALKPIPFVESFDQDMIHNFANAITAWDNGKMDGFDQTPFDTGTPNGAFAYSYVEHGEVAQYWALAHQYVLADHMFPMEFGPSFTSHLALIAGTDNLNPDLAEANYPETEPWGCDAFYGATTTTVNSKREISTHGPKPCFTAFRTMADILDAKHVSWRYYAPAIADQNGGQLWTSFDAIKKVRYGPDWKNVVSPQTQVIADAKHGKLASMTWVVPDWQDSDHPAANSATGPCWVSTVINAIGHGPDWDSTAVFLLWDDWGGWYDNLPPPQRDFRGNGMRVPLLVISPYARKGYVDHGIYESASVLRFVEETFHLGLIGPTSAGYTDGRAAAPIAAFDFTQKPRPYQSIATKCPRGYFEHYKPSYHVVDEE